MSAPDQQNDLARWRRACCAWADRPGRRVQFAVLWVQRGQQYAQQFWLALLPPQLVSSG